MATATRLKAKLMKQRRLQMVFLLDKQAGGKHTKSPLQKSGQTMVNLHHRQEKTPKIAEGNTQFDCLKGAKDIYFLIFNNRNSRWS